MLRSNPHSGSCTQGTHFQVVNSFVMSVSSRSTRTTRSRTRAAASRCHLLELSHDELGVIVDGFSDPLEPAVVVALGGTCKGLRTPLQPALSVLEAQHKRARRLCRKLRVDCAALRHATELDMKFYHDFGDEDLATLGLILRTGGLPRLRALDFERFPGSNDALLTFFQDLDVAVPSVTELNLHDKRLSPHFAHALAVALERGALPKLEQVYLGINCFCNEGVAALAAPLRKLPALKELYLFDNDIDDEGVASLIADLSKDDFKSLEHLQLDGAALTDTGCTTLITAINRGALPAMRCMFGPHAGLSVRNLSFDYSIHDAVKDALKQREARQRKSE